MGCMPCKQFEPFAEKRAKEETLSFRTIMGEDMPEKCSLHITLSFIFIRRIKL